MHKLKRLSTKERLKVLSVKNLVPKLIIADTKQFNPKQVDLGTKIEKEHRQTINKIKKNPKMSPVEAEKSIALDHLKENPNYYVSTVPVDTESLLVSPKRYSRLRRSLITKDKNVHLRAKKAYRSAMLRRLMLKRGQSLDLQAFYDFFSSREIAEAAYYIQLNSYASVASNVKPIIDKAEKSTVKNWDFLNELFQGDETAKSKLFVVINLLNIQPGQFIELVKSNRYDLFGALEDIDAMFRKHQEKQRYIEELKREFEEEERRKIERFKNTNK